MLNETFFVIFKHYVSISLSSFQLACVFELLEGSHVSATPPKKRGKIEREAKKLPTKPSSKGICVTANGHSQNRVSSSMLAH